MATTDEELLNSEDNFEQDTATDTGAPADSNTDVDDGGTSSTPPIADSTISPAPASSYWDTAEAEKIPYYSYMKGYEEHNPLESEEAYQKRLRRARNAAIIGAIGEGISSLANLYATTKGAPNAQQVQLSAPMVKRYEDMEKERAANKKAWYEGYQKAAAADEANAKDERNWRLQFEKERASNDRANQQLLLAQAKAAQQAEEYEYGKSQRPVQERLNEAKAQEAETKAKYAEETAKATLAHLKAQTAAAGRKSGGSGGPYISYNGDGTCIVHTTKENYQTAVYAAVQAWNAAHEGDPISLYRDKNTTKNTVSVGGGGDATTSVSNTTADNLRSVEELNGELKARGLRIQIGTSPTPSSPSDAGDTEVPSFY